MVTFTFIGYLRDYVYRILNLHYTLHYILQWIHSLDTWLILFIGYLNDYFNYQLYNQWCWCILVSGIFFYQTLIQLFISLRTIFTEDTSFIKCKYTYCDWYFIHQNTYSVKFIHFAHIPLNGYIFHYTCSHTPNMMDTSFPRCSHIRLNSYFYSRCPHISLDTSFIPHVCVLSNVYFIHYMSTRFVKWILFSLHVHTLCSMDTLPQNIYTFLNYKWILLPINVQTLSSTNTVHVLRKINIA